MLRIAVKIVKILREKQENFEDVSPFVVRGERWEVGVAKIKRGEYQFRTFDPLHAEEKGDRSMAVTGLFTYLEEGDIEGHAVGTIKPRYHIFTDFMHMIPVMSEILNNFEALMAVPVRHGRDDPHRNMPTEGDGTSVSD